MSNVSDFSGPEYEIIGEVPGAVEPEGGSPVDPRDQFDTEVIGKLPGPGISHRDRTPFESMTETLMGAPLDRPDPQPWTRLGTILGGSITGGILGQRIPGGPGVQAAGSIIGAGLGAGMGVLMPEATMKLAEYVGLAPPGYTGEHGLTPAELADYFEGTLLVEFWTGGGVSAATAGKRAITGWFTGIRQTGRELAEEAHRNHIAIMPVQVGDRLIAKQFVSVIGRFPVLFKPLVNQAKRTNEQTLVAFEQMPNRIAPIATMNEVALDIFTEAKETVKSVGAQFDMRFEEIFAKADDLGLTVDPLNTVRKGENLLKRIKDLTPKPGTGKVTRADDDMMLLKKLVDTNIMPLISVPNAKGNQTYSAQTLRQLDTILTQLDKVNKQFIKNNNTRARDMVEELRLALLEDMTMNLRVPKGMNPQLSRTIIRDMQDTDRDLSHLMQDLFNSAAAKKMGISPDRGAIRGGYIAPNGSPADNIAKFIMETDSPQVLEELSHLVDKSTFKKLASTVLADRVDLAKNKPSADGTRMLFDVDDFRASMGMDRPTTNKYKQTEKLLELSGGLTMGEVDKLVEIADAVASVEIPSVSAFISRRASIGGWRGLVRGLLPGAAMAGAGGAGAAAGIGSGIGMSGVIAGATAILGARGLSKMMSDPMSARLIKSSLSSHVSDIQRVNFWLRATRLTIGAMRADGEMSTAEANEISPFVDAYFDELKTFIKKSESTGGGGGG